MIFFDLNDEEELQKVTSFIREAPFFMRIAAESRRFGDIVLSDYADVTDDHEEKQFAAFCAELPMIRTTLHFAGQMIRLSAGKKILTWVS